MENGKITIDKFLAELQVKVKELDIVNKINNLDEILSINNHYLNCISNTIEFFSKNGNIKFAEELLYDIMKNPTYKNGKLYEALVYNWFIERKIIFEPQPLIQKEDCLKNNEYFADGKIGKSYEEAYFDVKKFGITLPHINTLKEKLIEKLPNLLVLIGGDLNISYENLERYALKKINDIVHALLSEETCNHTAHIYKIPNTNIEVRTEPKSKRTISSISQFDEYEWAKNNEFYFMHHGSQFCINKPYIIICPFDKYNVHMFANDSTARVQLILRALCRRIFMNLTKMYKRKLNSFDGKAKIQYTIADAARKISAIVFTDLTEPQDYNNCKMWVYVNPNADNPLHNYQIDSWFRYNGAFIDDFRYDNY